MLLEMVHPYETLGIFLSVPAALFMASTSSNLLHDPAKFSLACKKRSNIQLQTARLFPRNGRRLYHHNMRRFRFQVSCLTLVHLRNRFALY